MERLTLDQLGDRHRRIQEDLDDVRERLAHAIRYERATTDATLAELMYRSGYRTQTSIARILDPRVGERRNAARRVAREALERGESHV